MRVSRTVRWLLVYAACGSGTLAVIAPAPAAAQARSAAITARAMVHGAGAADVLGARAEPAPPAGSAGARAGPDTPADAWRITSGRNASLGIRVDGSAAVIICESPDAGAERCGPYRPARPATTTDRWSPELVVRVHTPAAAHGASSTSIRLTLAFLDF